MAGGSDRTPARTPEWQEGVTGRPTRNATRDTRTRHKAQDGTTQMARFPAISIAAIFLSLARNLANQRARAPLQSLSSPSPLHASPRQPAVLLSSACCPPPQPAVLRLRLPPFLHASHASHASRQCRVRRPWPLVAAGRPLGFLPVGALAASPLLAHAC